MLSIQSPKPRAHCSRCSTRPEQKTSFPSPGLDLEEADDSQDSGVDKMGQKDWGEDVRRVTAHR